MAEPGFWDAEIQVDKIRKTVEGLAAIAEAVQKAGRSAVCTIVNNTDVDLVRIEQETVHGAFATSPPTEIKRRSGVAFGVQSDEFSIMTGTAGWVLYVGGGMVLRCGWEVPWLGANGAETTWTHQDGREEMTGRYRTWDTAAGGNKKVPMDFVVTQIPEQVAWRYCRHCGLIFYDGYDKKGVCAKPAPTTRFDPGKADLKLYLKQKDWEFAPGEMSLTMDGSLPPPAAPPRVPAPPSAPASPSASAPVAKRAHEASGFVLKLCHSFPAKSYQQAGWRFCVKCHALFFDGFPENGACAATGGHEPAGHVFLLTNDTSSESWVPEQQPGWRFCQKCYGLFFDGYQNNKGLCAGGGAHHWNVNELPPWSRHFVLNHHS